MAKSKDDIKYATSQARLTEDEGVRVAYKHGTPLEGGKIADSEPVDLFSCAHKNGQNSDQSSSDTTTQSQLHRHTKTNDEEGGGGGGGGGEEHNTRTGKPPVLGGPK
ncbi:SEED MATURATION PROTEIN 1 [Humulus lupulus]|uniref:SEED MATURATION PROTEIN 1 n=1 Tax=Humulus lupulus TaxID=3486 RepID=UPI002B402730|nr:SEED MATURATION PROTEIN 1 [Humulus lupulus]